MLLLCLKERKILVFSRLYAHDILYNICKSTNNDTPRNDVAGRICFLK